MTKRHLVFLACIVGVILGQSSHASQCVPDGQWLIPKSGHVLKHYEFMDHMPTKGVLLLGEHHANSAHHKWQLDVIKTLHDKQPNMTIGLEMFPRRIQPALDQWVNGELDKYEFRELSEWDTVWSYNFDDYYPLFHYAQTHRIPLVALNVSQELLSKVRESGWHRVPQHEREGVSDPARPSRAYAEQLAVSFKRHQPQTRTIDKIGFKRFVQKQLLWDRAMAEGIANVYKQNQNQLIVSLMGSWHIIGGHGVPFQLKALDLENVLKLVPWDDNLSCQEVDRQFSDAIYGTTYQQSLIMDVFH